MPPLEASAALARGEPTAAAPDENPSAFVETEEAPRLLLEPASGPRYRGALDGWRNGVLSGWAIDLLRPDRPLRVAMEAAGRVVAESTTAGRRADLAEIFGENVAGFEWDLSTLPPPALAEIEAALGSARPGKLLEVRTLTLRLDDAGPHIDLGRNGVTARKALAQCRVARTSAASRPSPLLPGPAEGDRRGSPPPLAAMNFGEPDPGEARPRSAELAVTEDGHSEPLAAPEIPEETGGVDVRRQALSPVEAPSAEIGAAAVEDGPSPLASAEPDAAAFGEPAPAVDEGGGDKSAPPPQITEPKRQDERTRTLSPAARGEARPGEFPPQRAIDDRSLRAPPPQITGLPRNVFQAPRYLAGVDGLFASTLRGWAIDLHNPRAPVRLRLEAKGRAIAAWVTAVHRAEVASVLDGNVAGFAFDLATLPREALDAIAEAVAGADPTAPPPTKLLALRIDADNSLIETGVSVSAVLAGLEAATSPTALAPEENPAAPPAEVASVGAVEAPRKSNARDARALQWVVAHLARDLPAEPDAPPVRRFASKLLADIEVSTTVSGAVKRHAAAIAGLFDPFHYLEQLASPDEAIANPLLHYLLAGWREGLSPSPLFAPDYYRRRRGAVAGDPLLDFVRDGARLGADPHPLFDVAFYRERHLAGDVEINPLAHYLELGGRRRLDPSPLFDTARFLDAYGLGAEIDAPLEAFLADPSFRDFLLEPAFDAPLYRYQIEIERREKLVEPPFVHYLTRGWRDETLLPNMLFDPAFYREHNKLEFDGPALTHYLSEGEAKGLPCHPLFWPSFYNEQRGDADSRFGALAHALAHPGAHRSDPRMDDPVDPRLFAFVRQLVSENGVEAFDLEVYRDSNPDIASFDDQALEEHWRTGGVFEGRLASFTQMMRMCDLRIRDLPVGFVLDDYVAIYQDLKPFRNRFVSAFYHWGRHGRKERRLVGKWLFQISGLDLDLPTAGAPLIVAPQAERLDVCILIHVFYPDLLAELVAFAQNFRNVSFDIFINLVDISWTPELQEQVRAICPGAFVMLSHDAGRDVGGFTRLLEHVDLARYDLFAFMHSKKSPHMAPESGVYWRRALLRTIAGTPEIAADCVRAFRENPQIGLIGAAEWRSQDMGKNVEQYERLLDLLGVRGKNRELDYVSGFMFLIRSEVVARLFETLGKLDFEYGGDKDLDFHLDGQIAHGVERAVPALVRQMGYEVHYR